MPNLVVSVEDRRVTQIDAPLQKKKKNYPHKFYIAAGQSRQKSKLSQ